MAIKLVKKFTRFAGRLSTSGRNYAKVVEQNALLEKSMGVLLGIVDSYEFPRAADTANTYKSRAAQVKGCRRKYKGEADYGNQLLQRVVNMRVAFSVPNRLFLVHNDANANASATAVKEAKEYLNAFMAFNDLDGSLPKELAREAELQGGLIAHLVWNTQEKLPVLKYYPWGTVSYTLKPANDGEKFNVRPKLKATFRIDGREVKLEPDVFSYIAFNDELGVFEGYPTCGAILNTIENLDKDLRDWRRVNFLYAHPTPHFECETQEDATAIRSMIMSTGWRVGTAVATKGAFALKGTSGVEANLLMLSIQTNAKIISGHTGIGIHFLGFANVMSNRATADSMGEPTEIVLHSEIQSWQSFYNDLFAKAVRMRNSKLNRQMLEDAVTPKIVPLTDRQWQVIKNILLPLYDKDIISRYTFLEKIPDIDPDAELERLDEETAKKDAKRKQFEDRNRDKPDEEEDEDGGNEEEENN